MSTVNFNYTDASLWKFRNRFQSFIGATNADTIATTISGGTDWKIRFTYTANIRVFLDDVEQTAPTPINDGASHDYTILTGISEASHDLRIEMPGGGYSPGAVFLIGTGTSPAIALPAWTGTAAETVGSDNYIVRDGNKRLTDTYSDAVTVYANSGFRFRQTFSSLAMVWRGSGVSFNPFMVIVDGTEYGPFNTTSATQPPNLLKLVSGLTYAAHDVQIIYVGLRSSCYIEAFILGGNTGAWDTTALALKKSIALFGNSISIDWISSIATEGYVYKVGRSLGLPTIALGAGGSRMATVNSTVQPATARTGEVTGLPVAPGAVVVEFGTNDTPTETYTTLFNATTSVITDIRTAFPGVPMLFLSRLNVANSTSDSFYKAIYDAVISFGSANVQFLNLDGLSIAVGDGIHPTPTGYTTMAAPIVTALTALLSNPSSNQSIVTLRPVHQTRNRALSRM